MFRQLLISAFMIQLGVYAAPVWSAEYDRESVYVMPEGNPVSAQSVVNDLNEKYNLPENGPFSNDASREAEDSTGSDPVIAQRYKKTDPKNDPKNDPTFETLRVPNAQAGEDTTAQVNPLDSQSSPFVPAETVLIGPNGLPVLPPGLQYDENGAVQPGQPVYTGLPEEGLESSESGLGLK